MREGKPLNAGKIAEVGGLDRKEVDKAIEKLKKTKSCFTQKMLLGTGLGQI